LDPGSSAGRGQRADSSGAAATRRIAQLSRGLEDRGISTPFCHEASTCTAGAWFLRFASGISANGTVIVGTADNPTGEFEAYRAVVP
jgi:hypothetical protein